MSQPTILVQALAFTGDQRPTRSGVYARTSPLSGARMWSYFNARTKLWSSYCDTPKTAYRNRASVSGYQRLDWFALPYQVPTAAKVEHAGGLQFRITPPKA